MPIQKPDTYKALRRFTINNFKDGIQTVVEVTEGEQYRVGEYYQPGEYLPESEFKQLLGFGVLEKIVTEEKPSKTK